MWRLEASQSAEGQCRFFLDVSPKRGFDLWRWRGARSGEALVLNSVVPSHSQTMEAAAQGRADL